MAQITLQWNAIIETTGELPALGSLAPEFHLTALDLSEKSLSDFLGKRIVLNIFPSVDTETCGLSVKMFNKQVSKLENTIILCISMDLPFAQKRFCGAEGIENVHMLSAFRESDFTQSYQVLMKTGPLKGLLSRAVIIIDTDGKILYTEQVGEIASEPDYEKALAVLA